MFLDLDQKPEQKTAIIDNHDIQMSYGELIQFSEEFYFQIGKRTLIFLLCQNRAAALAAYVSCLDHRVVPLMVSANTDLELMKHLINVYCPEYIWVPKDQCELFSYSKVYEAMEYVLYKTDLKPYKMHEELALLLTTSGSTGSAKYVRHKLENVVSNARNIAEVFELDENENGMVSLPLQFTQGLNVATSHLLAGATALLSTDNLMQKEFWEFFKEYKATSMTCVPYSVELLEKLRFFRMDLPAFRTLNQGGGRLPDHLFRSCAEYAVETGRRFIPTYGATETTSRMACLPAHMAIEKCGSIGQPLPNCTMELVDHDGLVISEAHVVGEIIFKGPNVTMGYAECGEDLSKGDERNGVYETGDLAYFDEDGCFFIVGRKKRFVKIFGYRISLDETERMIKDQFHIECACAGTDKQLTVFTTEDGFKDEIIGFLAQKMKLNKHAFDVRLIEKIPKNDTGKTQYKSLDALL